jgi:hypothetical protein
MGKIYAPPKEIKPAPRLRDFMVKGRFDSKKMDEAEEKWIDELRTWCKTESNSKYVGEVIRQGVADGYAQYMVYSLRPLVLIHLSLGDGYQFQWAHRWTASDIKTMVDQRKKMESFLFKQA